MTGTAEYNGETLTVTDVAAGAVAVPGYFFAGEAAGLAAGTTEPTFLRFIGTGSIENPDYVYRIDGTSTPQLVVGDAGLLDPLVIVATGQSNVISSPRSVGGPSETNDAVFVWNSDNIGAPSPGTGWSPSQLGSLPYQTSSQDPADPTNPNPGPANNFVHNFASRLQDDSGRPVFVILVAGGSSESHAWSPTLDYMTLAESESALTNGTAVRGETRLDEVTGKIAVLQYGDNDANGSGPLNWDEVGKGYWQYQRIISEVTAALATGPLGPNGASETQIDLFLVEQGEGDFNDLDGTTTDIQEGEFFTENWTNFVNDIRSQAFAPNDLPFIFGELAEGGKWSERNPEIRALADLLENVAYSESSGLELQDDTVHPTGPGVYEKGYERYWDAYLTLPAPNFAPAAVNDIHNTNEYRGTSSGANLLQNDSDPNLGDVFSIVAVNGNTATIGSETVLESGALLTINANGTYSYDDNGMFRYLSAGEAGEDSFTYTIADSDGATSDATVTVQVAGRYDSPSENIDAISGTSTNDLIYALGGDDRIFAKIGNDQVFGGNGNDTIYGQAGDDILNGGAGGDTLNGGVGIDTASYAGASSGVRADLENSNLNTGDAENDIYVSIENLEGSNFFDRLYGDGNANTIAGGNYTDRLYGRAGDDILDGGLGVDAIYGNAGADTMTGGEDVARDRFIYFNLSDTEVGISNRDKITDFGNGPDRIEISRFDADIGTAGNQAFDFIGGTAFSSTAGELRYFKSGGVRTVIQGDVDGDGITDFEIELAGLLILDAGDFLL